MTVYGFAKRSRLAECGPMMIAERKLRRRRPTDDGNIEITGARSARKEAAGRSGEPIRDGWFAGCLRLAGLHLEDQAGRRSVDEQPTFSIGDPTFSGTDPTTPADHSPFGTDRAGLGCDGP